MNKTPKLRFKEFSGDWENKRLGDVAQIVGGGTPSTTESGYWNGSIPWFTPTDIKLQKFVSMSERTITEEGLKKSSAKILPKGTVLLTTRASLGDMAIASQDVTTNQGFQSIIAGNNINNEFIYYLQPKLKRYCYKNASGSTFLEISKNNIEKFKFNMPSLEEQEKIASFFSLIDKKISLQSEKVEMLKEYKKGMMQKIFSRELRFKDDSGRDYPEWGDGKVKNIITEHLYQIDKPSESYWRLGLRSHGKGTFYEHVTDPSKISMDKLYEVKKDMLIVNITFAWEHAIAVTGENDEGKLVSHRFPTYDFNDNAVKDFYKYYVLLPKFRHYLENASPGGAGRNRVLNKKQFLEICAPIPCVEEQNKIASVLGKLDEKIQKEQEKLESLNEYKKGLLQQMFV